MSDQLEFEFVIDDSDAKKKYDALEKQGTATAQKITDKFSKEDSLGEKKAEKLTSQLKKATPEAENLGASLIQSAAGWALALASVETAIKLIKLPFLGEQLLSIDAQFNRIASDAGLSGGKMAAAFEDAGRGLVDIDDILISATSAIINLGDQASKLPQILELSRRVTATLGGDLKERFEGITRAIETANPRLLRQNGIILDVDRVLKSYASSLGLATSELTQANRQQAILNATLEAGSKKFKDGEGTIKPLTDATTRLKISLGDLVEGFAKLAAVRLQDSGIVGFIEKLAAFTKGQTVSPFQQQARDAAELRGEILKAENQLIRLKEGTAPASTGRFFISVESQIKTVEDRLDSLRKKFQETGASVTPNTEPAPESVDVSGEKNKQTKLTEIQLAAIAARNAAIRVLQDQANAETLALNQQNADNIQDQDQRILIQKSIFGQQLLNLGNQRSDALAQLEARFQSGEIVSEQEFQANRQIILDRSNNEIFKLTSDFTAKQKQQYVSLASTAEAVFKTQLGATFQAFGAALEKGEDAGKAFEKAMIGIFGDIAIQLGNFYIAKGIALSVDPLTPGSGIPLIAAGAALNLLGGVLKAKAGGGGAGATAPSGGGTGGGGGGFTGSTDTFTPNAPEDFRDSTPKTAISVNVNGNILGTSDRSLGLAISEILSEQFSSQGLVLKG